VKAVVHGVSTGGIVGFFTDRDLKYKQVIAIREKPVAFKANEQQQETSKIKTWCCIDQGISSMWATFERNIYTPQETAKAMIHVNNQQCTLPVTRVKFFVEQKTTIRGHGAFGYKDNYSEILIRRDVVGPAAG
jgi:hypothetical protein